MPKLAFLKIISIIISLWSYGLYSDLNSDKAIAQDDVLSTFDPQQWAEIMVAPHISESRSIDLNFPYATTDNFVKNQLYSCPRCFLRPEVATAVQQAHEKLQQLGYGGLRLFDCYRPLPVQWEMWQIVPDPRYVGNPQKGSDHNRGTAVDLTIVDRQGNPLDFGTPFDEFTQKAHHTYLKLSPQVLKNRLLLKTTMAAVGFRHLDTEWWHYAWKGKKPTVADWVWDCGATTTSSNPQP
jgi:zinc D-Ala-D-Ala dipeptidase